MTEKSTESTDGGTLDDLPLENTRRTLLRALGGAAAVGGISGVAAGVDDEGEENKDDDEGEWNDGPGEDDEDERDDGGGDDNGNTGSGQRLSFTLLDLFDVNGLAVTDEAISAREVTLEVSNGGSAIELVTASGVRMNVVGDAIAGTSVDSIDLHNLLEPEVESAIATLANGDTPEEVNALPDPLSEQVESTDRSVYKEIDARTNGSRSVSDVAENELSTAGNDRHRSDPLIVVIVIIIAIILSFGGGLPRLDVGSGASSDSAGAGDSDESGEAGGAEEAGGADESEEADETSGAGGSSGSGEAGDAGGIVEDDEDEEDEEGTVGSDGIGEDGGELDDSEEPGAGMD
ncbi:hypothetical protein ACFR9U_03965 [Halorientalis brevis]|uniref:Uncharacterized protein n=1 Tax=Halorientalis brevis TaxID=1126241 RepID=A0ABD6C8T6_9EURY|nr:hypothetical protein [Halorientalis brevis]